MRPILILDTCVLVAGLRSSLGASHALLQMVGSDRFILGITNAVVLEYESVCKRLPAILGYSDADIDQILDYWCRIGHCAAVRFRVRPAAHDPNDDRILEAAIATGSRWIVTHNVADLAAGAQRHGIEVLTPAEALRRLGN
ncbi:MAG: PIN domain-containing protein [Planctomycetia bacterium]|nr:PIN domain-containing protein [Planctomycetia bacterium]